MEKQSRLGKNEIECIFCQSIWLVEQGLFINAQLMRCPICKD